MSHPIPDTVEIVAEATSVASIPPLESVGRIYEIGINGEGYMLADNPEDPNSLPSLVGPNLQAPRLATTDTPFSQAVERYSFEVFHDFSAGSGQKFLNRDEATARAFWDSEGVDPFTDRGELKLLPAVGQSLASTYVALHLVVVGDDMYAQTADNQLTRYNGATDTWGTPFTVTSPAAVVIKDLASDGQYWYAACGDRILRGQSTDPAATWSNEDADSVKWAAGRIMAAVKTGTSPVANRFTSLSPDGLEEVPGGHLTLDEGQRIVLGEAVAGNFYFGSYSGDQGQIWAWQLGVDSEGNFHAPYVAWDMPQGLIPSAVAGAAGEVWVRAWRAEGPSAGEVVVYRGIPGNGITPFLVAKLGGTNIEGDFREIEDQLVFSWMDTSGNAALGAVNLATGGYCRWLLAKVSGQIRDIVEFKGVAAFVVDGQGVYVQSATYETTGWIKTSLVDGASVLDKVLDSVTVEARPLLAGEQVEIEYSVDSGVNYVSMGGLTTPGAQRKTFLPNVRTGTFGLRLTLEGNGSSQCVVFSVQQKFHPLGIRDQVVSLRIKAYDYMSGLNGAPLVENKKGRGVEIMRILEAFNQNRVLFQDVDWHLTGVSRVMEVISVKADRVGVYDPQIGERRIGGTVELTLRRAAS